MEFKTKFSVEIPIVGEWPNYRPFTVAVATGVDLQLDWMRDIHHIVDPAINCWF